MPTHGARVPVAKVRGLVHSRRSNPKTAVHISFSSVHLCFSLVLSFFSPPSSFAPSLDNHNGCALAFGQRGVSGEEAGRRKALLECRKLKGMQTDPLFPQNALQTQQAKNLPSQLAALSM